MTDGRTDRRTDRILIARLRLHCMQRGKKHKISSGKVVVYYIQRWRDHSESGRERDKFASGASEIFLTATMLKVHLCGPFYLCGPLCLHACDPLLTGDSFASVWPFYTYIGPFTTIWGWLFRNNIYMDASRIFPRGGQIRGSGNESPPMGSIPVVAWGEESKTPEAYDKVSKWCKIIGLLNVLL